MKLELNQEVGGNAEQVAGGNVVTIQPGAKTGHVIGGDYYDLSPRPYIDPNHARICPNCGNVNQRYASPCWVCAYDLQAWDSRQRRDRIIKRSLVAAPIGLACVWAAQFIPYKPVAFVLFVLGALAVFAAIRASKTA